MDEIITISSMFDTEVYFSKKFIDDLQADIKRLQEENKKLKEFKDNLNNRLGIVSVPIDDCIISKLNNLEQENKNLKIDVNDIYEMYKTLKQALEEIREITNFLKNKESNGLNLIQVHQYIDEMQTKINEVLK